MPILKPGDVATVLFLGAAAPKRRPVVVVSSDEYQRHRPDVVVAILTSNLAAASTPFDYVLQDWAAAGLKQLSASEPTSKPTYRPKSPESVACPTVTGPKSGVESLKR